MNNKQFILYLLTGDESHLPEEYPAVDRKKWAKKNDLQKAREIKRVISSEINTLKGA